MKSSKIRSTYLVSSVETLVSLSHLALHVVKIVFVHSEASVRVTIQILTLKHILRNRPTNMTSSLQNSRKTTRDVTWFERKCVFVFTYVVVEPSRTLSSHMYWMITSQWLYGPPQECWFVLKHVTRMTSHSLQHDVTHLAFFRSDLDSNPFFLIKLVSSASRAFITLL